MRGVAVRVYTKLCVCGNSLSWHNDQSRDRWQLNFSGPLRSICLWTSGQDEVIQPFNLLTWITRLVSMLDNLRVLILLRYSPAYLKTCWTIMSSSTGIFRSNWGSKSTRASTARSARTEPICPEWSCRAGRRTQENRETKRVARHSDLTQRQYRYNSIWGWVKWWT